MTLGKHIGLVGLGEPWNHFPKAQSVQEWIARLRARSAGRVRWTTSSGAGLSFFGALTVRSAIGAKKGSPTGPPLSRNGAVSRCSAAPDAWVQRVAQPVTDIVHRQNCHRDGNTGKQDAFGEFLHPYHGVSQHFAPCRKVRGEAYAKE